MERKGFNLLKTYRSSEVFPECFHDSVKAYRTHTHIVEKGGRNSGKSTKNALTMVKNRMRYKTSGLGIMRFANTIGDSIFQDTNFAINLLGVQNLWKSYKSPYRHVYLPTGTSILYRGADDRNRVKGIKSDFPITDCWFSEVAEFKHEEDLDVIIDSILRGKLEEGLFYRFLYDYNPPKRKGNWINKKYGTKKPIHETFVNHTTVFDNQHATKQMIDRANIMEIENKFKYRWIYLGEAIGGGVVPFDNLTFRTITNDEVKSFDNILAGIDWGYANDIFAYIRLHYDATRKKVYLLNEIAGLQLKNEYVAEQIKKNKFYERITADSAEPKSVDLLKDMGLSICGAKKGPGSVETGEKWLNDRAEIIIDYNRTPKAAKQFEDIDYARDRQGMILRRLEDNENDFIDAVRYTLERYINKGSRLL